MKVLIGCECSGVVRRAFRDLGHDAWSCDLQPSDDGSEFHFQCDIFEIINNGWDMAIFHPPCDYLTVSGNRWFSDYAVAKTPGILTGKARRDAREEAVEFVKRLWNSNIPKVVIENPIGTLSTLWMKPTQTVQPFHFGDPFRKGTCLWVRGLPKLVPTSDMTDGEQACWKMAPTKDPKDRKKKRSETYPMLAKAIAEQWGGNR